MRIISLISIKRISQTSYLFTYKGIAISWRYVKQILVATSLYHSKIIAIHETSRSRIYMAKVNYLAHKTKKWIVNH